MKKILKFIARPIKLYIDNHLYKIIIKIIDILHIKFPKKADFIIIGSHGLGRNAFLLFLQYCNVRVNWYYAFEGYYKRCYMYLSLLLFKPKNRICAMTFAELNVEKENKIVEKINQKIPTIVLTRDPISILKTHINLRGISKHCDTAIQTTITKQNNSYIIIKNALDSIHDRICYRDYKNDKITESKKPSLDFLHYLIETTSYKKDDKIKEIVLFSSLYRVLKDKISELIFIDMQNLSKDNAFNTMQNLAKKFNFQCPNSKDFFTHKLYGDITALIPLTISINGGGKIIFSTTQQIFLKEKCIKNVSNIFFKEDLLYGLNAYSNSDIDKLDKELITLITIHLNTYYKTILEIANTITANLINEDQIIEYLNKHKELKTKYKIVFDDEVSIVKKYAPNIVESWVYYNKFNKGNINEYHKKEIQCS